MKTNKTWTTRLRVTKRGKIIARRPGQNHFNAKEGARTKTRKRRPARFLLSQKNIARFLG